MAFIWRFYMKQLELRPLTTKIVASATFMGACDLLTQKIENHDELDLKRTARMMGIASVFIAPPLHYYFNILDKRFPAKDLRTSLQKLAIDQLAVAPANIALFMGVANFLKTPSFDTVKEKLQQDFWPTLKANWVIWPASNLINFMFIPPPQRVLYISVIGFFWNIFLSYKINK